jgi:hypothetical protein
MSEGHNTAFIIEQDEVPTQCASAAEACAHLDRLAELGDVDVWVLIDRGQRRGWFLRLLGYRREVLSPCFHLEKTGEFAALTFLDDVWSEYRAVDPDHRVEAPEDVRLKLSGGEPTPAKPEFVFSAIRAFAAAKEFLSKCERPEWLTYHYVR